MKLKRRSFLAALATGGALLALNDPAPARRAGGFFASRGLQVGLQLYTLGDEPRRDLAGSLARVAAIGYREIELPELYGKTPKDIRSMADAAGVKLTSVHLALSDNAPPAALTLRSEAQRIAEDLTILGIRNAVLPMLPLPREFPRQAGEAYPTYVARALGAVGADYWKRVAGQLNDIGSALQREGVSLGYHNHGFEFSPVGETTGWDILVRETDPGMVSFEVDIGWAAAMGIDPTSFLRKHAGRVSQLHVKDVKKTVTNPTSSSIESVEIGYGIINWHDVLHAAFESGARHFYVEQEPPFDIPRMDSISRSFAFLNNLK